MQPNTGHGAAPNTIEAQALAMAAAGYHVAPVRILLRGDGKKIADTGGMSWALASTTDPATIHGWFGAGGTHRGWSYLIDCGKSGIVAIDTDVSGTKDGPGAWRALGMPTSMMAVRTRTGGYHGYYRADPAEPIYNSTSAVADGVDTRGVGGIVFGPGSFIEGHENDQRYELLPGAPIPVPMLPVIPAAQLVAAMTARNKGQRLPASQDLHIQRDQAYTNLLAAAADMVATLIGYGLNTAIWRLGVEAGQWGAALEVDEDTTLAWVHDRIREHPQILELDADDLKAAARGVEAGYTRPWRFFSLTDLIADDFERAGQPLPETMPRAAASICSTPDDILAEPEPPALLNGLIDQGSWGLIYGPGGSGKSFFGLDLALSVASGRPLHGRGVAQTRVLFVAAEGRRSAGLRTATWREMRGYREPMGSLMIWGRAVNLSDVRTVAAFRDWAVGEGYGLVFFDTYARCTPDVEENSSKDTGRVIRNLELLQDAGITTAVIHHTSKDGKEPRGSSALLWACDWGLSVEKRRSAVTITNARQKDREDGNTVYELVLATSMATEGAALVPGAVDARPDGSSEWAAHFPAMLDLGATEAMGRDRLNAHLRVAAGQGVRDDKRLALQQAWQEWFIAVGSQKIPDLENAKLFRENWTKQGKTLPPGVGGG